MPRNRQGAVVPRPCPTRLTFAGAGAIMAANQQEAEWGGVQVQRERGEPPVGRAEVAGVFRKRGPTEAKWSARGRITFVVASCLTAWGLIGTAVWLVG